MASRAAGKTSRVYGSYTKLMCKLMISTWGYLFKANKKENIKNTCEPRKIYIPFGWALQHHYSQIHPVTKSCTDNRINKKGTTQV